MCLHGARTRVSPPQVPNPRELHADVVRDLTHLASVDPGLTPTVRPDRVKVDGSQKLLRWIEALPQPAQTLADRIFASPCKLGIRAPGGKEEAMILLRKHQCLLLSDFSSGSAVSYSDGAQAMFPETSEKGPN